jgi:UDP-N-acetylmuramate dehydrogenase
MERTEDTLSALCGTPISDLAEFALSQGLTGLEFAYFLPGTVGGALWMNARCYDRSVSDVLLHTDALCFGEPLRGRAPDSDVTSAAGRAPGVPFTAASAPERRRIPFTPEQWGYKLSPFQRMDAAILGGCFRLAEGDPSRIRDTMQGYRADREKKGHFLHPCAGSVFKNDRSFGAPTGKLIDQLGLKGRLSGGAQIAPYHGNIIINLAENEVERKLGFRLQREVILAGEW